MIMFAVEELFIIIRGKEWLREGYLIKNMESKEYFMEQAVHEHRVDSCLKK